MGRLFGSRELVLALAPLYDLSALFSSRPRLVAASSAAARLALQLAVVADSLDALTGTWEWFAGNLTNFGFAVGPCGAAFFVAVGLAAQARL